MPFIRRSRLREIEEAAFRRGRNAYAAEMILSVIGEHPETVHHYETDFGTIDIEIRIPPECAAWKPELRKFLARAASPIASAQEEQ